MQHYLFMLICLAILSLLFTIVGTLSLLGWWNAEVIFWTRTPIRSDVGKIAWIVISAICFIVLSILVARAFRRRR